MNARALAHCHRPVHPQRLLGRRREGLARRGIERDPQGYARGARGEVDGGRQRRNIFTELAKAGVAREDLQIAWDYTTASKSNVTRHIVEMRDKALAAVGDDGPKFTVKDVEELPEHPDLLRRLHLVMTVPLYLTSASIKYDKGNPMDRLNLGPGGELEQNGTMQWGVLVLVPRSVQSGKKHGLLQNGHGLFGDRTEGQDGYLAKAATFSVNGSGSTPTATRWPSTSCWGTTRASRASPSSRCRAR